jgi:hypothetical protein
LLGFASAVLAYNVLAVLKRSVEQAHRQAVPDDWEASIFHLTVQVRSGYEGMQIALPPEPLSIPIPADGLAPYLLTLAKNVLPKAVAKSKRGPKVPKSKEWLEGKRPGIPSCAIKPAANDAATTPQSHSPAASAGE